MNRALLKSELLRRIHHRLGEVRRDMALLTTETDVDAVVIVLELSKDGQFEEAVRLREAKRTYPATMAARITAT